MVKQIVVWPLFAFLTARRIVFKVNGAKIELSYSLAQICFFLSFALTDNLQKLALIILFLYFILTKFSFSCAIIAFNR